MLSPLKHPSIPKHGTSALQASLCKPGPSSWCPPRSSYDDSVRCPFRRGAARKAVTQSACMTEAGDTDKVQSLNRSLRSALHLEPNSQLPPLDWKFVPSAIDTLGAPSHRPAPSSANTLRRLHTPPHSTMPP